MESKKMTELVQNQLEAYNARDLEKFCSYFHEDVQVARLVTGEKYSGKTEFMIRYRSLFESSPQLHCELKSRIVLGESVLDEEWVTGAKNSPDGIHAVAVYAFRDGLIDRVWFAR